MSNFKRDDVTVHILKYEVRDGIEWCYYEYDYCWLWDWAPVSYINEYYSDATKFQIIIYYIWRVLSSIAPYKK